MAQQHAFKVFDTQTGEYEELRAYFLDQQGRLHQTLNYGVYLAPDNLVPHFPADIRRREMELREGETEVDRLSLSGECAATPPRKETVVDMLNRVFPVGSKVWWSCIGRWNIVTVERGFYDDDDGEVGLDDVVFDQNDIDYNREHPILD